MAVKWNNIKIKINVTISIFSTLELSSNLGNNRMLTQREREREREISKRNQTSIK